MDLLEPSWAIWYGVGGRRFYAVATWRTTEPLLVQARTIEKLRDLMRDAEQTARPPAASPLRLPHDKAIATSTGALSSDSEVLMTDAPSGLQTVCWDIPGDLAILGPVRGRVIDILSSWKLNHLAEDVALVVAELLANAILHGEPPIRVSLWAGVEEFCIRVTDHGAVLPRHLHLGIDAAHGRGLAIVAALTDDHGVTPTAGSPGKSVWARWRLRPTAIPLTEELPAYRAEKEGQR